MRIDWNDDALHEVRSDPAVVAMEVAAAQQVCDRANAEGKGTYAVSSQQGEKRPQGRWRTTVITADAYAARANAKHNILIRAMGASGS